MDHAGEAGIGKSRLTAALLERLTTELHARYFCSPQRTDSFLYPIVSQMERAAGFTHDDDTQAKLNKLDALLAKSFTPPQDAVLLADMLSLPNDGRYTTLELDPQERRQRTLKAGCATIATVGAVAFAQEMQPPINADEVKWGAAPPNIPAGAQLAGGQGCRRSWQRRLALREPAATDHILFIQLYFSRFCLKVRHGAE